MRWVVPTRTSQATSADEELRGEAPPGQHEAWLWRTASLCAPQAGPTGFGLAVRGFLTLFGDERNEPIAAGAAVLEYLEQGDPREWDAPFARPPAAAPVARYLCDLAPTLARLVPTLARAIWYRQIDLVRAQRPGLNGATLYQAAHVLAERLNQVRTPDLTPRLQAAEQQTDPKQQVRAYEAVLGQLLPSAKPGEVAHSTALLAALKVWHGLSLRSSPAVNSIDPRRPPGPPQRPDPPPTPPAESLAAHAEDDDREDRRQRRSKTTTGTRRRSGPLRPKAALGIPEDRERLDPLRLWVRLDRLRHAAGFELQQAQQLELALQLSYVTGWPLWMLSALRGPEAVALDATRGLLHVAGSLYPPDCGLTGRTVHLLLHDRVRDLLAALGASAYTMSLAGRGRTLTASRLRRVLKLLDDEYVAPRRSRGVGTEPLDRADRPEEAPPSIGPAELLGATWHVGRAAGTPSEELILQTIHVSPSLREDYYYYQRPRLEVDAAPLQGRMLALLDEGHQRLDDTKERRGFAIL